VRSSHTVSLEQIDDTELAKEELLDLANNQELLFDSESVKLDRFWSRFGEERPFLTTQVYRALVPYVTTYLRECKEWSKLKGEHVLVAVSEMSPRNEMVVGSKQQKKCSHQCIKSFRYEEYCLLGYNAV
jgi:hypothetical protein